MRLREAMIAAIRYDATLVKHGRTGSLAIDEKLRFISTEYRSNRPFEVKLSANECLSEDWTLSKDGKEFVPDSYYYA